MHIQDAIPVMPFWSWVIIPLVLMYKFIKACIAVDYH